MTARRLARHVAGFFPHHRESLSHTADRRSARESAWLSGQLDPVYGRKQSRTGTTTPPVSKRPSAHNVQTDVGRNGRTAASHPAKANKRMACEYA